MYLPYHINNLNRKTVTDLLTCASLYEISRGLFSFSEIQKLNEELAEAEKDDEDEKHDLEEKEENDEAEKEKKEEDQEKLPESEEVTLNGTEDLAKNLEQFVELQDNVELEDHISKSIKKLTSTSEEVSKEDEVINDLIAKDLSKVDDAELEEKIRYCKKNAQRIVTAVKKGENPQINTNSIDSKPITDEDIDKTIKFAMNEPSDEENDSGVLFPELPKTTPGISTSEPEPKNDKQEISEEEEDEDSDTAEFVAKHHTASTNNKPISKQIKKEDIQSYIEDGELLERATKCAKFGISAINYEDIDTALAELTKSIDLLNQYKKRQE